MLTPLARALWQLSDPVFLNVVLRSLLLSLLAFVLVLAGSSWGLVELVHSLGGWIGAVVATLGGLAVLVLAVVLFIPAALFIATFYIDTVAEAVERQWYPALPRPSGAALPVQVWDGVALGAQVLGLQLVALLLAFLLPGVGLVLGYLVTGWGIGRGLFVAVAMRRMGRAEALALYARHRWSVLAQGVMLALAGSVPPLNLLVPVVGTAAMVHVLHEP